MNPIFERVDWVEQKKGCIPLFVDYTEGHLLIYIHNDERSLIIEYPTIAGVAYISSTINDRAEYLYEIGLVSSGVKERFTHKHGLDKMGSTRRETLHGALYNNLDSSRLIPEIQGVKLDKSIDYLLSAIRYQLQQSDLLATYTEYNKVWYAQAIHKNKEHFFVEEQYDIHSQEIARKVLLTNNVLNKFLKVMNLRVVGQHSQLLLKFLAALSSATNTPMNTIGIGDSSSGKTWTEDTVYGLFPEHRKIKLDADTTKNSILRMTYFQEGKHFFKGKWVYLGDLGDKDEFKRAAELMSVMKVLMSEQAYRKGVSEKDSKTGDIKAEILELDGCGSVSMQLVTTDIEKQFGNRTIFWSPIDTMRSREAIKHYQEDIIQSDLKYHMYKNQRNALSCAIDKIFRFVEVLEEDGSNFKIYNPFLAVMGEKYKIDQSPNVNRDRLMMNMIPNMVTLANCFNRDVYYNKSITQYVLVVTPKDYEFCINNMGTALSSFLERRTLSLYKYVELIEEHIFPKLKNKGWFSRKALQENIEDKESFLEDVAGFTVKDLLPYSNMSEDTLRRKLHSLEDLGLFVIDDRKRTLIVQVPKEYNEVKKEVFREYLTGDVDESNPISNDDPMIENIYNQFLIDLIEAGYCKIENPIINQLLEINNSGDTLDHDSGTDSGILKSKV